MSSTNRGLYALLEILKNFENEVYSILRRFSRLKPLLHGRYQAMNLVKVPARI
jgi:hypothetical protein